MSKDINIQKIVNYWLFSAKHDYQTMLGLFRIKRYSDCLFYGHIVLEKILKALVVKKKRRQAKYTHNLVILAKDSGLDLLKEQLEFLAEMNRFNIRARYPDIRLEFYKRCDKKYTENYLEKIKKLYKFLCQKIKEKN